jgi:hypothetical protein
MTFGSDLAASNNSSDLMALSSLSLLNGTSARNFRSPVSHSGLELPNIYFGPSIRIIHLVGEQRADKTRSSNPILNRK